MSEPTRYEACVVSGVEGPSLYLNSYRIAGPKPWGGGHTSHEWNGVTVNDLFAAFPELRALRESHAELLAVAKDAIKHLGCRRKELSATPRDDCRCRFHRLAAAIEKAEAING